MVNTNAAEEKRREQQRSRRKPCAAFPLQFGGILLLFVLLSTSASAYVQTQSIQGLPIRTYDHSQADECLRWLSLYPQEWREDLRSISILSRHSTFLGIYYPGGVMYLYSCDAVTVAHEMAHHKQFLGGAPFSDLYSHSGSWADTYRESLMVIAEGRR